MPDDRAPADVPPATGGPGRLRPTVIVPAARPRQSKAQRAEPGRSAPPVAPVSSGVVTPTAIPGVERKRIAVTAADMARLSPGVAPAIAARAIKLVESFVVEGARDRDAVLWGHAAQQEYATLVSQTLELSQDPLLTKVSGYVGRMSGLLGAIDLEAICGITPAAGPIGQWFRRATDRIDTPAELSAARDEIDHLVRLTGAALEPLLALGQAIDQQSRQIDAAGASVEAAALAAAFLSEHLQRSQPALSRRFLDRSMSLTESALQIRGSASLRENQIEQPLQLIAAIQNVALVTLPGWLSSLAALTSVASGARPPTPTQAGELADQLRTILQHLQT